MTSETCRSAERPTSKYKMRREKNKFTATVADKQEGYIGDQEINKILSALGEDTTTDDHSKTKKKTKKGRKKPDGEPSSPDTSENSKSSPSSRKTKKANTASPPTVKKANEVPPEKVSESPLPAEPSPTENVMLLKLAGGREISLLGGGPAHPNETLTDLEDQEFEVMKLAMQKAWEEYMAGEAPVPFEEDECADSRASPEKNMESSGNNEQDRGEAVHEEVAPGQEKCEPNEMTKKTCRICLNDEIEEWRTPCLCSGTIRYVCVACLERLVTSPNTRNQCVTCRYEYKKHWILKNVNDWSLPHLEMDRWDAFEVFLDGYTTYRMIRGFFNVANGDKLRMTVMKPEIDDIGAELIQ
ncbi:hypothetical protein QR680_018360 [Steinernema hermaphroditum]|uniref:RING-CH-type domain-containing protein n=1 Tax=Steinernema hermaphroditum TaxID=289476 RepID=A0AA39LQQ3_9BILA|nr:hypothetical protein QR680_018360 [Steinernema hermaphroditum]